MRMWKLLWQNQLDVYKRQVLDVALDVFTLPLPSSITLLSTVVLLDFAPSTNVFSSTVDVLVLAPSLIT